MFHLNIYCIVLFNARCSQMEKVESDLNRSKQLREKQAKELQKQLEEQRLKYEQKVAVSPTDSPSIFGLSEYCFLLRKPS